MPLLLRPGLAACAAGLKFRETPGDYDFDFHCAPAKQFVVSLDAGVEIEVTDGTRRVFPAGTVMLAEDTWGKVVELKKSPQRARSSPVGAVLTSRDRPFPRPSRPDLSGFPSPNGVERMAPPWISRESTNAYFKTYREETSFPESLCRCHPQTAVNAAPHACLFNLVLYTCFCFGHAWAGPPVARCGRQDEKIALPRHPGRLQAVKTGQDLARDWWYPPELLLQLLI